MMNKLLFALILSLTTAFSTQAQNTYHISGKLNPSAGLQYALLYQVDGMEQKFIKNTELLNGVFDFTMNPGAKSGVYRLVFDLQKGIYFDVYFDQENINFEADPEDFDLSVVFSSSKNNQVFYDYKKATGLGQSRLDEIQVAYLSDPSSVLAEQFNQQYSELEKIKDYYLSLSKGLYVEDFVKAHLRDNPQEPVATALEYLTFVKLHYFDHLDFKNPKLLQSDYLYTKVTDYIFYLSSAQDVALRDQLQKQAIDEVMSRISVTDFEAELLELILSQFMRQGSTDLAYYTIENYYQKLPLELQDQLFIQEVKSTLAIAVGNEAPNFSWTDQKGSEHELQDFKGEQNIVLVFWSSTCGHCLNDIPQLYESTKNHSDIRVIAVGLEDTGYDQKWKTMVETMPNWTHVLGLDKWENPTARLYNIIGTPTYIVLNKDLVISSKPYDLDELKENLNLN
jgi:thiol-disulfide isomerase/thioredoxin